MTNRFGNVPVESSTLEFEAESEADTFRLGAELADVLPPGTTVALIGTLGAGKTRLVQALAQACGLPPDSVTSPTFVLCQHYQGSRTLHHLDAYRLRDDDEFWQLGVDEYFDSDALTLVEWADRVSDCLPDERLEIEILVGAGDTRTFRILGSGSPIADAVQRLSARLQASSAEPPRDEALGG